MLGIHVLFYLFLSLSMCLPHQVVFEVAFNSPSGGRVAIDDIFFSPQFCRTDSGELQPQSLTASSVKNLVVFTIDIFMIH